MKVLCKVFTLRNSYEDIEWIIRDLRTRDFKTVEPQSCNIWFNESWRSKPLYCYLTFNFLSRRIKVLGQFCSGALQFVKNCGFIWSAPETWSNSYVLGTPWAHAGQHSEKIGKCDRGVWFAWDHLRARAWGFDCTRFWVSRINAGESWVLQ